jgi:hypothetical protein
MPLALSDAALARVAIACTAIPPNARGKWLERFARKLDPPARPATRQQRYRGSATAPRYTTRMAPRSATDDHDDRTPTHG